MPVANIPAWVRFVLYLVGAVALLVVGYAGDKGWAGDAETRLVTNTAALLQLLAATRVDLARIGPEARRERRRVRRERAADPV